MCSCWLPGGTAEVESILWWPEGLLGSAVRNMGVGGGIAVMFQEEEGNRSKLVRDRHVKLSYMGLYISSSQIFSVGFGIPDYKSAFLFALDAR